MMSIKLTPRERELAPAVAEIMGLDDTEIPLTDDCEIFLRYEAPISMSREKIHGKWHAEYQWGIYVGYTLLESLYRMIVAREKHQQREQKRKT